MSERKDEDAQLRSSAPADVVRRYEASRGLLLRLITRSFQVSPADAEALIHETFMACEMEENVADVEAWLIAGAIGKAAKGYQRANVGAAAPDLAAEIDLAYLRDALTVLPEHAHEALRLRFEEGRSYPEIAATLGMSVDAVQRIAAKAIARVRTMQRLRGPAK